MLALAFSRDGTVLASGSSDRSAVTWDATGASLPTDPMHRPKDAADAWARLADRDAAARPAESVPLFAKHLRPVPAADPKAVAGLIEKLGSADFAEREAAEKALAAGEGAADQLRAAAATAKSAEVRRRVAVLLMPYGGAALTGDRLRATRAVEAVERAGTADARKLLRDWAGGAPGVVLTEASRSALARIGG